MTFCTDPVFRKFRVYPHLSHLLDNCLSGFDEVIVHNEAEEKKLVSGIAILVDDFHLLDDSRLSRLARACAKDVRGGSCEEGSTRT